MQFGPAQIQPPDRINGAESTQAARRRGGGSPTTALPRDHAGAPLISLARGHRQGEARVQCGKQRLPVFAMRRGDALERYRQGSRDLQGFG